ncbi:MAG TPA: AAA family ATPase, partial [Ktedonobacteraceae bacterium]
MTAEYEAGKANLDKLIEWWNEHQSPTRNEASTRFHLIDTLFFDCLGWSKDDMIPEEPHGPEYADYTFLAPRRILIVEAKRESVYFELPSEKTKLEYSLPALMRDYPSLKKAIEQVAGYCQSRGVPYAAVCNGTQIVAFVAARSDGSPPLDGKAMVFSSLSNMASNFLELWQALSKPGIEDKWLQNRLIGTSVPQLPPKLSATILGYPGTRGRNPFQADLSVVSELVLEDVARAPDLEDKFLEECYSQSGALSQYSLVSKTILKARYAALYESEAPGPTTLPAAPKSGVSHDLLAESLSRRPILLIGDVGVGKTTFIRHLIRIDAAPLFENSLTLNLDLGTQATLTADLRSFVPQEIARQLLDKYGVDIEERNFVRGVYHAELERFGKGIYTDLRETNPGLYLEREIAFLAEKLNNREEHVKSALEHLAKGWKKQIVIFLDNADQRDDNTQQTTFLIAQEMADRWPATVFVALRPETFHRSMRLGALSGYHPKAFTISPPRIDRVIEKRLQFGLKI